MPYFADYAFIAFFRHAAFAFRHMPAPLAAYFAMPFSVSFRFDVAFADYAFADFLRRRLAFFATRRAYAIDYAATVNIAIIAVITLFDADISLFAFDARIIDAITVSVIDVCHCYHHAHHTSTYYVTSHIPRCQHSREQHTASVAAACCCYAAFRFSFADAFFSFTFAAAVIFFDAAIFAPTLYHNAAIDAIIKGMYAAMID